MAAPPRAFASAWFRAAGIVLASALLVTRGSATVEREKPLHPALAALPRHMAWAWERDEDLRWLPTDAGVAYVAASVWLEGDTARVRPRAQRLLVNDATPLVPIVHVDASTRSPPRLDDAQRDVIVGQLLRAAGRSPSGVVQLDFEARLSQRAFLGDVLRHARAALPAEQALSMTALASWCGVDAWLRALPVDEVVPMAFRMASGSTRWRGLLGEQHGFANAACRGAIGTSTDEPLAHLQAARRYVFSPSPWTPASWAGHPF